VACKDPAHAATCLLGRAGTWIAADSLRAAETRDLQPGENNRWQIEFLQSAQLKRREGIVLDRVQGVFCGFRGGEKVIEKCEVPEPKKSLIFGKFSEVVADRKTCRPQMSHTVKPKLGPLISQPYYGAAVA
jgi:hypothetical protein